MSGFPSFASLSIHLIVQRDVLGELCCYCVMLCYAMLFCVALGWVELGCAMFCYVVLYLEGAAPQRG